MEKLTLAQLLIVDKSLSLFQIAIEGVIGGITACRLVMVGDPVYDKYEESQQKLLAEVTKLRLMFVHEREPGM